MRLVYETFNTYYGSWSGWDNWYYWQYMVGGGTSLAQPSSVDQYTNQLAWGDRLWVGEWYPQQVIYYNSGLGLGLCFFLTFSVSSLFIILYLSYILLQLFTSNMTFGSRTALNLSLFIQLYLYSWIFGGEDKVESLEEIVCLFILWPWCIFLIFTHLFSVDNHSYLFGFAEWGLPVLYGLILLGEHLWAFGIYIFIYLVGIRGRRSLLITLIEDCTAFAIMVARVLLQAIRGLIVGMFHFICREALLNMTRWWEVEFWYNSGLGNNSGGAAIYDIIGVCSDLILGGGSLVVIMAIMFLQLTFLIVSVWLFCRCWFISWNIHTYWRKYRGGNERSLG